VAALMAEHAQGAKISINLSRGGSRSAASEVSALGR
jgi:hypothetical protein